MLGLSRSPNPVLIYSDSEGVNSKSSLNLFWQEFHNFELSENERTIARLTQGAVRKNYTISDSRQEIIKSELGIEEKKIVLIVLQVEDDSNIVAGSKYQNMQEYVNDCLHYKKDDVAFIIKKHPAEFQCKIEPGEIPVITTEYPTEELVGLADGIFTINSSVGFEALIAGKRVFTFGRAPYAIDEFVT
ncbi:MAG: hypothetical protein XXXJIFNMEKO3_00827 [Candidatus Erwinia impunctatus]